MIDFPAAYTALKFTKEALKFTLDQKIDQTVNEKILEAMDKIGKVQDDLFQVREDLLRLQEENHHLIEKIRDKETWEGKSSLYELVKTEGNAIVYRFKNEPVHFACPVCMVEKQIQILQELYAGTVKCPKCRTKFDTTNVQEDDAPASSGGNLYGGY
ncbi:hypothetical protein KOM00_19180 [Geomonas sp. Red69]|uniref:hypothetical protein n=1 Tax=Geomonas diazotrophica TaxID=2843197 RepID=UPI001C11D8A2|nr:hypothetical protein [Geomonas diazotrophica]MBU5638852.1 hypothetical protein [Geomonas diazotrophica]